MKRDFEVRRPEAASELNPPAHGKIEGANANEIGRKACGERCSQLVYEGVEVVVAALQLQGCGGVGGFGVSAAFAA